jgi:hypothetical protein
VNVHELTQFDSSKKKKYEIFNRILTFQVSERTHFVSHKRHAALQFVQIQPTTTKPQSHVGFVSPNKMHVYVVLETLLHN